MAKEVMKQLGSIYGHFESWTGSKEIIDYKDVEVSIYRPRNPKHHRKVMGMCNYVMNNVKKYDDFSDVDDLLFWFKDTYNHYKPMKRKDGTIGRKYKSFKFSEMDEIEFIPIAEELKQFCYILLNRDNCSKEVIEGLLNIEFN